MTTWKDGGDYGRFSREIINEDGSRKVCAVQVRQSEYGYGDEPWPKGERNFALILQAPVMLEALEAIRDQAECYLQPLTGPSVSRARWEVVRSRAVAAIAAVKGEDGGDVG